MKTTKMIDLLVKIANGGEVPKKIRYGNATYELNPITKRYIGEYMKNILIMETITIEELNDEVEIIEDKQKCEWCEEGRYTIMSNKEIGTLYCMNLDEDDDGYLIEILKQRPPKPIWETKYTKRIYYCPFCGRKLESKGE